MTTAQVRTKEDGTRSYLGLGPEAMNAWSLTTILRMYPKDLSYPAGMRGVEVTAAVAHAVAQEYAEAGIDFGDFEFSVLKRMGQVYGVSSTNRVIPPHVSEWAAARDAGSAVHLGVERHIKLRLGLPAPGEMEKSPIFLDLEKEDRAVAVKTLAAFHEWATATNFQPFASETVVWLKGNEQGVRNRVACRIDVGAMLGGAATILDVKTGKLEKGKKPYKEQMVQAEIQRLCWNARVTDQPWRQTVERSGILHVPAEGGPVQVFLNEPKDRARLAAIFDRCADLYHEIYGEPR